MENYCANFKGRFSRVKNSRAKYTSALFTLERKRILIEFIFVIKRDKDLVLKS